MIAAPQVPAQPPTIVDISFQCERCGQPLRVDEACAGLWMKCVRCLAAVPIPEPTIPPSTTPAKVNLPATVPWPRNAVRWKKLGTVAGAGLVLAVAVALAARWLVSWTSPLPGAVTGPSPGPPAAESVLRPPEPAGPVLPSMPETEITGSRFSRVAGVVWEEIRRFQDGLGPALALDAYAESLSALADRVDSLLAAAEETGSYEADPRVRELCITVTALFFDYKQALNQWALEELLWAQLAELNSLPDGEGNAGDPLRERKTTLTTKANAARQARTELWAHARELGAMAEVLVSRLPQQTPSSVETDSSR